MIDETTDSVTPFAAAALHGLLDAPGPPPAAGQPLPPLWHWLSFLDPAAQSELGPDGHRATGVSAAPEGLPRRMFAGVSLRTEGVATVGEPLARRTTLLDFEEKHGRTGRLAFTALEHDIRGRAGRLEERHELVFREASPAPAAVGGSAEATGAGESDDPASGAWVWGLDLDVDPVVLFRFSALTYNAHRIHYDAPYATRSEGYPGLVTHGPLQAVGLAEILRRHLPGHRVTALSCRAVGPAFAPCRLELRGRPAPADSGGGPGRQVELAAFDGRGRRTMVGTAGLDAGLDAGPDAGLDAGR